jgi:hypothetical protein
LPFKCNLHRYNVGARLAVQLTHAATAVRITVLTSAGGVHWAPNETDAHRMAPLGLARVAIYASSDDVRARAVARMELWKNPSEQAEAAAAVDFELVDPAGPNELAGEFGEEVVAGDNTDADATAATAGGGGGGGGRGVGGGIIQSLGGLLGKLGRRRRRRRGLLQYEHDESDNPYSKADKYEAAAAAAKVGLYELNPVVPHSLQKVPGFTTLETTEM